MIQHPTTFPALSEAVAAERRLKTTCSATTIFFPLLISNTQWRSYHHYYLCSSSVEHCKSCERSWLNAGFNHSRNFRPNLSPAVGLTVIWSISVFFVFRHRSWFFILLLSPSLWRTTWLSLLFPWVSDNLNVFFRETFLPVLSENSASSSSPCSALVLLLPGAVSSSVWASADIYQFLWCRRRRLWLQCKGGGSSSRIVVGKRNSSSSRIVYHVVE